MEFPIEEQVIDTRLVERFAVCRDDPASGGAQPDARAMEIIGRAARAGARQFGAVLARARKVVVDPSLTVVVVPGRRGLLLVLPHAGTAFGALTEAILDGSPIGSSGPLVLGVAPDGVGEQAVTLSDGSTTRARVVSNVYAVTDPSWVPPKLA